jgi:hypothetical protein
MTPTRDTIDRSSVRQSEFLNPALGYLSSFHAYEQATTGETSIRTVTTPGTRIRGAIQARGSWPARPVLRQVHLCLHSMHWKQSAICYWPHTEQSESFDQWPSC